MRFLLGTAGIVWRLLSILMAQAAIGLILLVFEPTRLSVLIPYLIVGFIIGIPYAEVSTREGRSPCGKYWLHDPLDYSSTVVKFALIGVPWSIFFIIMKINVGWQQWQKRRTLSTA